MTVKLPQTINTILLPHLSSGKGKSSSRITFT